jgi:hypothetical protein
MDYKSLTDTQKKLVPADWRRWNPSQELEFLGGTQALANWCDFDQPCKASLAAQLEPGLEQVNAVQKVRGTLTNAPSEDQYNIEVAWQPGADKCFDRAYGWGIHLAQLHPGMYGYDQNKWNDSLLGLVVLFNGNDSKKGQFHIGFGDLPDHYSADANSNIERNYRDYCGWYGPIKGYKKCVAVPPPPPPPPLSNPAEALLASPPPATPPTAANGPLQPATPQDRLPETVQAFLNT